MFGSNLGRFTSPDPTLLSLRRDNPQTFNRYAYVLNNPLNYTDPLGLWELAVLVYYKHDKDEDGNLILKKDKNNKPIVDRIEIVAFKSKDDDDGASLASQLGLTGKEAASFASSIGADQIEIRLSETSNETVRDVYSEAERGLFDEAESQRKDGTPPNTSANCAGVTCYVGGFGGSRSQYLDPEGFQKKLQNLVKKGKAIEVTEDTLRVGDTLQYATSDGKAKHFANFIFRTDEGVPQVYSKSGAGKSGSYHITTASSLEGSHNGGTVVYGNVNGYYRKVKKP
jgi:hypothetical protein